MSKTKINKMKIPESVSKFLTEAWNEPGHTAKCILQQSDFYIEFPGASTAWDKDYARRAQLAYYMPLNLVRSLRVYEQLKNNPLKNYQSFFAGIENYYELGSGLSPSYFALHEIFSEINFAQINFIENSTYAQDLHKDLLSRYLKTSPEDLAKKYQWLKNINWSGSASSESSSTSSTSASTISSSAASSTSNKNKKANSKNQMPGELQNSLVVCSYALTEFNTTPNWLFDAKALILIEPATREDGRRLLKLRSELIERDFEIWAPCTHQQACPLLNETKNDWCHDRIHLEKPLAFQKIENLLPIKNDTLTLSYLIAKKKPNGIQHIKTEIKTVTKTDNKIETVIENNSQIKNQLKTETKVESTGIANSSPENVVRVVGDYLNEKGKSRQMVCRSPKREFLTQLRRQSDPLEFERGDLLQIIGPTKLVDNEIRMVPSSQDTQAPTHSEPNSPSILKIN